MAVVADCGALYAVYDADDRHHRAARAFLREFGVSYPNGMDPGSRIAIDYGVYGIPETFFIDRQGRITYKHVGALDERTLAAKIEEARAGIASAGQGTGDYRAIQ